MTARHDGDGEEPTPVELRAATVRELQGQFAGARVWFGESTGSWWALVPSRTGARLLEAATPQLLREAMLSVRARG
ncbi:hypothetical protein [Spirillospora sp. CA-294931]|uniref:hypothetical protein n=1 Tax=Spirillospora sp. CA-294931 TaxID=3240042 RepID=UPI003D9431C2